jgi:hypothetical protein
VAATKVVPAARERVGSPREELETVYERVAHQESRAERLIALGNETAARGVINERSWSYYLNRMESKWSFHQFAPVDVVMLNCSIDTFVLIDTMV